MLMTLPYLSGKEKTTSPCFSAIFENLLSVLLAPVSQFFACLQQTLTVALMISNGDTPTTTRCLQKHDIITLIGNYP